MKRKLFALLLAGIIAAGSAPMTVSAETVRQHIDAEPYSYDLEYTAPTASDKEPECTLEPQEDGCFTGSIRGAWEARISGQRNLPVEAPIGLWNNLELNYQADLKVTGNGWFGVHLTTKSGLQEGYIVEGWGEWRPPGVTQPEINVRIDGVTYAIYRTTHEPAEPDDSTGKSQPVEQFWSVRITNSIKQDVTNECSGTVSLHNHISEWSLHGLDTDDKLTNVQLFAEGYGGPNGINSALDFAVKRNRLRTYSIPHVTEQPIFSFNYEDDQENYAVYGSATCTADSKNCCTGSRSLKCADREADYYGVSIPLDIYDLNPETEYCFRCALLQNTYRTAEFRLSLQYQDQNGETHREPVTSVHTMRGKWAELMTTALTLPENAHDMQLLIETPGRLPDYYLDSVTFSETEKYVPDKLNTAAGISEYRPETKIVPYKTLQDGQPFRAHQNKNYSYTLNGDGLKDIMGPYFRIGAGINAYEITDEKTQEFVLKNFNTLTAANEMKPEAIISEVNGTNVKVNLNGADNILKFAEENGIGVRGHCFVWYSQTPDILFRDGQTYCDAETADARIDSFIKNTFAQLKTNYPNLDLYAYDVANEILQNEKGGLRKQSGDPNDISRWANVYGENSIGHVLAGFRAARKYAPENCKLFLSDYNEYIPEKTEGLVNLAKELMKEDLIDGIGMQAHLATSYPDSELFESALKQFHALGLDVEITELDIIKGYQGKDAQRRRLWKEIFKAAMTNADFISSVSFYTTSGFTAWDADPETELFRYLGKGQGYRPLPAYYDVIALADEIPSPADIAADFAKTGSETTATGVTTSDTTYTETVSDTTASETAPTDAPKDAMTTGDANCDGAVDISDAVMVARFVNSDKTLKISDQGLANADFDGNGQTNADDITCILKLIARMI